VYLLKEPLKSKLNEQYKGPYKILEILESNNVKLAISDKRTRIVHSDKLKVCRPDRLSRHNPTSPSRKRHLHYVTAGTNSPFPRANRPTTQTERPQDQSHLDSTNRMAPLLYICILLPPLVTGLIRFDCGGHRFNITTLSLLDIGNCELAEIETSTEETYVQLLQLSDYDKPRVQQCKVEVHRTIFYCGMHSHISVVQTITEYICRPCRIPPTNDCIVPDRHTISRRERDYFWSLTEQHV